MTTYEHILCAILTKCSGAWTKLHAAFIGQQPPLFGPCLLRPNGRPFQQLLSSCFHLRCSINIALVAVAVAQWIVIKNTKVIIILNLCF